MQSLSVTSVHTSYLTLRKMLLEDASMTSFLLPSDVIDIVNDTLSGSDYKKEEDARQFVSEKTGRGPLTDNWITNPPNGVIMCSYKLIKVYGVQHLILCLCIVLNVTAPAILICVYSFYSNCDYKYWRSFENTQKFGQLIIYVHQYI